MIRIKSKGGEVFQNTYCSFGEPPSSSPHVSGGTVKLVAPAWPISVPLFHGPGIGPGVST